jgi:integrase
MATLQTRNDSFRVLFLYQGKRYTFTIGKVSLEEAETTAAQVDYLLLRLKQGFLKIPPGVDVVAFVEHDGAPPAAAPGSIPPPEPLTLGRLRDRYLETHSNGTLEATTLDGVRLHFKHLVSSLGEKFPAQELGLADLQRHVDRRAKQKGVRGRKLSPATIRKEIVTLRTAWNWAVQTGLVAGKFPFNKNLRFPKLDEKPPFQTREEIERQINRGGLSAAEQQDLWDCLYLRPSEMAELLEYARVNATQPWVYPLVCTAAHTGARRSELLRLDVGDIDFAADTILVHEKKRARGMRTTRRVSLTPFLKKVLQEWVASHPGGRRLFSQCELVARSKKRSKTTGHKGDKTRETSVTGRLANVGTRVRPGVLPVTKDEAHDHFKRTLSGGKWKILKGYHVLRHSFVSCLAAAGVDQRIIDEFVGHQTEEQRRRYRHLVPDVKQKAISNAFEKA